MKKILVLISLLSLMLIGTKICAMESTPLKITLVPGLSFPYVTDVKGIELGMLGAKSENLVGIQAGLFSATTLGEFTGLQTAFVCQNKEVFKGVQNGFINIANDMRGIQWGLINVTKNLKGIQIGVFNIATQAPLPFMIGINAAF